MANCKICGSSVHVAPVFHAECLENKLEELAQDFCANRCRFAKEVSSQIILEEEYCNTCPLVQVLTLVR